MRIVKDAWFLPHTEWYTAVEGVGYIPTEIAPPEAIESMKRLNEWDDEDNDDD